MLNPGLLRYLWMIALSFSVILQIHLKLLKHVSHTELWSANQHFHHSPDLLFHYYLHSFHDPLKTAVLWVNISSITHITSHFQWQCTYFGVFLSWLYFSASQCSSSLMCLKKHPNHQEPPEWHRRSSQKQGVNNTLVIPSGNTQTLHVTPSLSGLAQKSPVMWKYPIVLVQILM